MQDTKKSSTSGAVVLLNSKLWKYQILQICLSNTKLATLAGMTGLHVETKWEGSCTVLAMPLMVNKSWRTWMAKEGKKFQRKLFFLFPSIFVTGLTRCCLLWISFFVFVQSQKKRKKSGQKMSFNSTTRPQQKCSKYLIAYGTDLELISSFF